MLFRSLSGPRKYDGQHLTRLSIASANKPPHLMTTLQLSAISRFAALDSEWRTALNSPAASSLVPADILLAYANCFADIFFLGARTVTAVKWADETPHASSSSSLRLSALASTRVRYTGDKTLSCTITLHSPSPRSTALFATAISRQTDRKSVV